MEKNENKTIWKKERKKEKEYISKRINKGKKKDLKGSKNDKRTKIKDLIKKIW